MLLDVNHTILSQAGEVAIRRDQEIPQDFLDDLRASRLASSAPSGEYHRVAAIPTNLVEIWLRQGFNAYEAPARDIVARLKREGLDAFLATTKRV